MPKTTILHNHAMRAEKSSRVVERPGEEPTMEEVWTMAFADRQTGDSIQVTFDRTSRDELVRQLTGGIVIAGGELPKGGPHLADGGLGFGE